MPRDLTITRAQLDTVRNVGRVGTVRVSSRTDFHRVGPTIAAPAAKALADRGLVEHVDEHHIGLTDAGRALIGIRPAPNPADTDAYRRGLVEAARVRRIAIREVTAVLDDMDPDDPAYNRTRAHLDRLVDIEHQEATP